MKIHKKIYTTRVVFQARHLEVNEDGISMPVYHTRPWHVIKVYEYPQWIVNKHSRFFDLRFAQLQLRFSKFHVDKIHANFVKAGEKEMDAYLARSIASLKGQVTKVENAIAAYEQDMKMRLIWEPENDSQYQRALAKLEQKKKNLKEAIGELKHKNLQTHG